MGLIRFAMGRPVTVMVAVLALVLMSVLAVSRMKIDIFPQLRLPRITVVQPYGGMDPAQMEGYMVTFYEQHFFYISGIEHVTSRSIQSAAVMDIYFQPDVDMADAMSQVVAQVERSRAYMPPGTVTPFILRFDVGNVPVGFIVFDSQTRSLGDIQDLVYARVRPVVSTIPGVSTPPPFGGNQRSIVVTVNAQKLNQYHLSLDDIVDAISNGNLVEPSGIVRTGDLQRMTTMNSVVSDIQEMGNIPMQKRQGPAIYLRDIATIKDSTDILTGYATVNGKRTVYMAISKQASASTVAVVDGVKNNLPWMQSLLPADIKVSFAFDQSVYVTEALKGLLFEGALGALLTGGVVLLFLGDIRSSLIVVLNIPFALLAAVVGLWIAGQTINLMTLSGLSLAVGILVDEATVTIENIHSHLALGKPLFDAIWDASLEVVIPRLLAMLSVVSVFMPSFFMVGVTQSMFVPLSLAVGLAMFASYILSGTFVPALSAWILKAHPVDKDHPVDKEHADGDVAHNQQKARGHEEKKDFFYKVRRRYQRLLSVMMTARPVVITLFIVVACGSFFIYPTLGRELFPSGNPSTFQLRIKAPTGTRFEKTEEIASQVLQIIDETAGHGNVDLSIGYIGTQPPSYAISNVYMWTSGPQEAILMIALREGAKINTNALKEKLRKRFAEDLPEVGVTFEAGDIVNKIINLGSPTPIQVDINGPSFTEDEELAKKLMAEMKKIHYLRDVGIVQPLDYPTIKVNIDRIRAGQMGVSVREIGRAIVAGTYSSRFVSPIYWADPRTGLAYQVQVEVPPGQVDSVQAVGGIPVKTGSFSGPFVRDVATTQYGNMPGELDHYNMRRLLSIAANIAGDDLGKAATLVNEAIKNVGEPPRGIKIRQRGQVPIMEATFQAFLLGVVFAIVAIYLMLVAFFQSPRLAAIIISVIPAILCGALVALLLTHTTLNIQSFMGAIMAVGVGVANSILVVVFAEERRQTGISAKTAAVTGAAARLRPVLMTSIAMIAGMIPMALGMGEGGERTAPLGRAVIGGLLVSTAAVLLVLPLIYSLVQKKASRKSASVLPERIQRLSDV
jgi:multidrug efflux pump subunit AcrB